MEKHEAFLQDLIAQFLQPGPAGIDAMIENEQKYIFAKAKKAEAEAEFKNDCQMWILQLKSFVLDTLIDNNKRNSQTFLDFLDELNKISVIA